MVTPLEGTRVPSSPADDTGFLGEAVAAPPPAPAPRLDGAELTLEALAPRTRPSSALASLTLPAPANRPPAARVPQSPAPITGTVGTGAANRPADVRVVQERLRELGHADVVVSGRFDRPTSQALKEALAGFMQEQGGAPERADRLVPTSPATSYFFGLHNARLSQRAATIPLTATVGTGQANDAADVRAVQMRLRELGFDVGTDGQFGPQTSHYIRLFASIVLGAEQTSHVNDLVAHTNSCCTCSGCSGPGATDTLVPGSAVAERLFSSDAPRWSRVPSRGTGFINTDTDNHGYALDRSVRVIEAAGEIYARYMEENPGAPLIGLNDISTRDGRTSGHHTHRNGLDIDVRLPRREAFQTDSRWGTSVGQASYDREATWAMLVAFAQQDGVERVLFNDQQLINRARREGRPWAWKLQPAPGHHNHIHVDVLPPTEPMAPATPRLDE